MNSMKKSILLTLLLAISSTSFISAGENTPSLRQRISGLMRRLRGGRGSRGSQVTPAENALTAGQTTPPPAAPATADQPPALPGHSGLTPDTNRNLRHPTGLTPERNTTGGTAAPSSSVTNVSIPFTHHDGGFHRPTGTGSTPPRTTVAWLATDPQVPLAGTYPPWYIPGISDMGPASTAHSHDGGFYRAPVRRGWTNHPQGHLAGVFPPGYEPAETYSPGTGDMGATGAAHGTTADSLLATATPAEITFPPGYVPSSDDSPTSTPVTGGAGCGAGCASTDALSPSMLFVNTSPVKSPVRSDSICTICQEAIDTTKADISYCHPQSVPHTYHTTCLQSWIEKHGTSCPNCARKFTRSPIKESNRPVLSPMPVSPGMALFAHITSRSASPEIIAEMLANESITAKDVLSACTKIEATDNPNKEISNMLFIALATFKTNTLPEDQRVEIIGFFKRNAPSRSLSPIDLGQALLSAIQNNNIDLIITADLLVNYAKKTKKTTMKKIDSTIAGATNSGTLQILEEAITHASDQTFKEIYELLSAGDMRCIGAEETTHAFLFAARSGKYDIVTTLLELPGGSNLLAARGSENETPLMLATRIPNNTEMVTKFLQIKRETLDDTDHDGHTVLTHPETLPEYHAVLNMGRPTAPPIEETSNTLVQDGSPTAPPMTSEEYEDYKALFLSAVARQDLASANEYLKRDHSLANLKDSAGTPAIILATQTINIAMIDLLKRYGADLTATNIDGHTAYQIAIFISQDSLFDLLNPTG